MSNRQAAIIKRWGGLWTALGAPNVRADIAPTWAGLSNAYIFSGIKDCAVFDYGTPSRGVSIQPDRYLGEAFCISAEEADVLQQLLLGTTLTQQETNK